MSSLALFGNVGGALCREQAEEWQTKKCYLDMELLGSQRREEENKSEIVVS